jgi:hypothetical protein
VGRVSRVGRTGSPSAEDRTGWRTDTVIWQFFPSRCFLRLGCLRRTAMAAGVCPAVPRIAMLLIHGSYHFWPKRVAFRNDYCLSCDGPRRAIAVRTFDVGHIFWIPILPVGFWRHWVCSACNRNPHISPRIGRSIKWAGVYCFVAVSVIFWVVPPDPEFALGTWFCRVAAPAGAIVLLVRILRALKPPLKKRLATIPPASDTVCPFCRMPLATGAGQRWSCPACGIVRY